MNKSYNIMRIIRGTTVDGPGFRTSIYLAGCHHACKGCHNPDSWNFKAGKPMSLKEIEDIIREEDFDVTLSGGDPLYHPDAVKEIARIVHDLNHSLWLYTGFTWEEIIKSDSLCDAAAQCDVIVDSPFIEELRDTDLLFRGSSNQRIIDVKKSLSANKIIKW